MKEAYIVKGYRTAVGKAPRGLFRFKRPDELAAQTINYMINDIPNLDKKRIDDVIVGNAMPEAEQGLNIGRLISLMGLGIDDVPGVTINRYCASGLETIALAAAKIKSGMAHCVIAGGVESMSFIPMGGYRPVPGYKNAKQGNEDYYWGMGLTAEQVANDFSISREDQDKFAYNSQMKALLSQKNGVFEQEIVKVVIPQRKKENIIFDKDEFIKPNTSIEILSKLRAAFKKDGSVTAGNSSGLNDGAAAMLLSSDEGLKKFNLKPKARIISSAVVGVEPKIMGIGPVYASIKALNKANLSLDDMDVIEINEAFSAQALACIRELKLEDNDQRINPNGGAIALGHPLGMSGTRIIQSATNELIRKNKRYALITMCIGVGQGYATIIEKI